MITRNNHNIDQFSQVLQNGLPELQWTSGRIGILTGLFDNCYRIRLSMNSNVAFLFCGGLIPRNPQVLSDINSLLLGPLKVAKRRGDGAPFLVASWPVELSTTEYAKGLAQDLRRLIFGPLQLIEPLPIDECVKSRLRDAVAVSEPFRPVPSDDRSIEFLVGKGKSSFQVRAMQSRKELLAFTVLLTNFTANSRPTQEATATTMFLLNRGLKWSRLVVRLEVIEVEITIPIRPLSARIWQFAKHALSQAASIRDILRIVQEPLVAEEVRRIVMKNQ